MVAFAARFHLASAGLQGTPPQSTCFEELLPRIPPDDLAWALSRWVQDGLELSLDEELQAVSIDGKTLKGTLSAHQRDPSLVGIDHKLGCVLSQMPVDEKTNEHKAAMELLDSLVLKGRVLTGDAIFCQREVCEKIHDRGGHYFVVVKNNQPTLRQHIASAFVETGAFSPLRPAGISGGTPDA